MFKNIEHTLCNFLAFWRPFTLQTSRRGKTKYSYSSAFCRHLYSLLLHKLCGFTWIGAMVFKKITTCFLRTMPLCKTIFFRNKLSTNVKMPIETIMHVYPSWRKPTITPCGECYTSTHIMHNGKTHFRANVVLLGSACMFWHKTLSDWRLRLDLPPVAARHGWLVIKNMSPSSWLHPCLHTRHTKICSHSLWHRPYIRLCGNESSVNTIAHLSLGWWTFCRLSAWWLRDVSTVLYLCNDLI